MLGWGWEGGVGEEGGGRGGVLDFLILLLLTSFVVGGDGCGGCVVWGVWRGSAVFLGRGEGGGVGGWLLTMIFSGR